MPDIGDVIELIGDIPGRNLRTGSQGTIVHCHNDDFYEVEFTDEKGETLDFFALHKKQFIVIWRYKTKQYVSIAERASAIIANLPDEVVKEVLDFALFLTLRSRQSINNNTIYHKDMKDNDNISRIRRFP